MSFKKIDTCLANKTGKCNQSIANLYCDEFYGLFVCFLRLVDFFCIILQFDFEFMRYYYEGMN